LFFNILENENNSTKSARITKGSHNKLFLYPFSKNRPHKFSRSFNFDIENGMSPSKLLKDMSLKPNIEQTESRKA
jgi:hypothetical protein